MAIASFLVLVGHGRLEQAAGEASRLPGVSLVESGDSCNFVAVAETRSAELPGVEKRLRAIPGVLGVSTAMVSVEDELEAAGGNWARA